MKRKIYDIDKDFKKWSKINPPINKFVAPILQFFLKPLMSFEKSSRECKVEHKVVVINSKKIRFLEYTPEGLESNANCLIYYHGGGYMLPAAPYHYKNVRQYATACACKVFVPDYPLSPKNKFPVAIDVCFKFYEYILANVQNFGVSKDKIAVGGDSAGASLASIVCMLASDNGVTVPLAQMLIYPVVGTATPTSSMLEFDDTGMCNNRDFEKYSKLYFASEEDKNSKYSSSLNHNNLALYPPTYIETAEFDCLRDEGKLFAKELLRCGVEVTEHHTQKTIHGYDIVQDSPIVKQSILKRVKFLNNQFGKKFDNN